MLCGGAWRRKWRTPRSRWKGRYSPSKARSIGEWRNRLCEFTPSWRRGSSSSLTTSWRQRCKRCAPWSRSGCRSVSEQLCSARCTQLFTRCIRSWRRSCVKTTACATHSTNTQMIASGPSCGWSVPTRQGFLRVRCERCGVADGPSRVFRRGSWVGRQIDDKTDFARIWTRFDGSPRVTSRRRASCFSRPWDVRRAGLVAPVAVPAAAAPTTPQPQRARRAAAPPKCRWTRHRRRWQLSGGTRITIPATTRTKGHGAWDWRNRLTPTRTRMTTSARSTSSTCCRPLNFQS
mmetsp:Transcript_28722/g.79069  ORF Transcript_28722/g.79069 Transcript_28722/m.79069 type:complete len:290 (+) Transcript_28722:905-1774(+)